MTVEIYVTQTRTYYPEQGKPEVHLYGRTEDGEADIIRVLDFDPHFYVPEHEGDKIQPKDHRDLSRVEENPEQPSLNGESLTKIIADHPGGVRRLSEQYDKTYEADVGFTNRLRIDEGIYTGVRAPDRRAKPSDIEAVEMEAPVRYCYYDIEIDDRGSMPVQDGEVAHTDSEVVSIVAYDSFADEYHGFLSLDDREPSEVLPEVVETGEPPGCLDKLHPAYNEKQMLREWAEFLGETNPDVLLAWNNLGFDAPYLIKRMEAIGMDGASMARGPTPEAEAGQYDPELSGRVIYDLMKAWKRMQYSDVSQSLQNAAEMELGDDAGKINHEETLYDLWQNNAAKLLRYNGRDVSLMVEINEAAGVMDDREELKDTVGVDYEETYEANDFIEMLARRKLDEWGYIGPTKTPPEGGSDDDDDYEGALTMEAFEGRKETLVSIDVASLYPMTMWMLNSSPETLVGVYDDPQAFIDQDDRELSAAPNGAVFRQDEDGLFRALVDEALELTQQAGRRRDEYDAGSDMWAYWNQTREARKRIRNGLYGVLGWVWFFLYDEPVAESVTTMSQEVIKSSAKYINENTAGEVVYGDTDSCYISWPNEWSFEKCLEHTDNVVETLETEVYPRLAGEWGMEGVECKWEMDIEDASETMFMAGKKKRYAKRVVWKEGMDFDTRLDAPEYSIKGFEVKRSDSAELLNKLQKDVFGMILDGAESASIRKRVFEAAQKIERRDANWDLIGIPGGIGKPLDEYDADTAQVRGAKVGNELLGLNIGQNDKPKRLYVDERPLENGDITKKTDVICYNNGAELSPIENQIYVDVSRMQDVVIKRPMGRILDCLGIDVEAAITGRKQNSIADYV